MRPDQIHIPEDLDAEKGLLSSLCGEGDNDPVVVAFLREDDFHSPQNRFVYQALKILTNNARPVNSLTLKDALERANTLNRVGGFVGLTEILGGDIYERPMVLAEILRRKGDFRKLIHLGNKIMSQASQEVTDPGQLVLQASEELAGFTHRSVKGLGLIGDAGTKAMDGIEDVRQGRRKPGVPTGLPRLDIVLGGGFKPGQLVILAARPGFGKTTLAMGWAKCNATSRRRVAVWSLEMTAEELWLRLACADAGIDAQKAARGCLNSTERIALENAKDSLSQTPLLVNDRATITVTEIRAEFNRAVAQMGEVSLVVVDYLQLLSSPEKKGQSDASRVADISRALKLFAKDAGVPVLVLSQLNREVEKRTGGRPQLSDLRDSGAIEQDADIVMFLHRKHGCADNEAELHLAKHRNGPTAVIPLAMDLQHYNFRELERLTSAPMVDDDE